MKYEVKNCKGETVKTIVTKDPLVLTERPSNEFVDDGTLCRDDPVPETFTVGEFVDIIEAARAEPKLPELHWTEVVKPKEGHTFVCLYDQWLELPDEYVKQPVVVEGIPYRCVNNKTTFYMKLKKAFQWLKMFKSLIK